MKENFSSDDFDVNSIGKSYYTQDFNGLKLLEQITQNSSILPINQEKQIKELEDINAKHSDMIEKMKFSIQDNRESSKRSLYLAILSIIIACIALAFSIYTHYF